MKKTKTMILGLVLIPLILTGCAKETPPVSKPGVESPATTPTSNNPSKETPSLPSNPSVPQGITVNKVNYTILSDIPPEAEAQKNTRGFQVIKTEDTWILVIQSGEKRTAGYTITPKTIEDNEGKTIVVVEEKGPGKDEIAAQVITYPLTVVKITSGIAPNFIVQTTEGEKLTQLN